MADILTVKDVYFSFEKKSSATKANVLDGISFFVKDHQSIGITGKSGMGKTTLALIVAGVLRPNKGEVRYRGINIYKRGIFHTRRPRLISMVFQNPIASINPRRTIESWLRLARKYSGQSQETNTESELANALEIVGLDKKHLSKYPSELSGGENQRACLAASLITNAKCVILDEPTTMLDNISINIIISVIKHMINEEGTSFILISHNERLIKNICDNVYSLDNGKLNCISSDSKSLCS
jgi:ABC-type glutathione transport system ATPase component